MEALFSKESPRVHFRGCPFSGGGVAVILFTKNMGNYFGDWQWTCDICADDDGRVHILERDMTCLVHSLLKK